MQLLAAADALTICAADRVTLAAATGKFVSLDHDHCWLWFSPDENTATIHGVIAFLAEFRNPPIDLDGWARAVHIGVGLAAADQAEARRDRFSQARYAAGMAPDGGMGDKTLTDALRLVGARPPHQLAASS